MNKNVLNKLSKIESKVELAEVKVDLALMDDINKAKTQILADWKAHVSKRDSWGAESSKILGMVGEHERKGVTLKSEVDVLDKKVLDLSAQITKLRNQADALGLELPEQIKLLDGVQLGAWSNKFVDTREIVDEFSNNLK